MCVLCVDNVVVMLYVVVWICVRLMIWCVCECMWFDVFDVWCGIGVCVICEWMLKDV